MDINEKKAENTPAGGVLVGKKDGQTIIHDEGTMSGYLVGKLHKDGGIKAVNKATGQPLEMQGGEVVITAPAVSDQTKREFEGKMMTNREILSAINQKGGGVSFAEGGEVPERFTPSGASYNYGGRTMTDHEILHAMNGAGHLSKGKSLKQIAEMHNVSLAHINEQLAKGLEVEKEHFADFKERTRVAKDHLVENPNYYTILAKAGLKRGGKIEKEDLVEDAKSGNTPARDLNNYNDLLDVQADGAVGGDSGIYAKGGQVSNFFKKTYGNLVEKQGIITTKTDWFNKDGVKVLQYGFDPYRNEESNTLFYYSWDFDDSGMDYDDFRNQLVDFFKKTYKKDVSELKALYVGWDRKEKDTYANGGITPYDANSVGDSVPVLEDEFAKGGVVYDTTKPKIEKITIVATGATSGSNRASVIGRYASTVSELQQIVSDYIGISPQQSYDYVAFNLNDNTRGKYYINLNKGKKNTVQNVNPETLNSMNFKRVIDAKTSLVKNYDWTDFFEGVSNKTVRKGKTVDRINVVYFDTNGIDRIIQEVGNPIQLYNFLKKLHNDGKRYAEIQPSGNGIVEYPKSVNISTSVWQDILFVKPEKEAIESIMNIVAFSLFPKLDFSKFNNRYNTITNASTSAKPFDLTNTKIWIDEDRELSETVQNLAFKLGWAWGGVGKVIKYLSADSIYFGDNNVMSYGDTGKEFFNNEPNKEITIDDLLGTQTPTASTSAYKTDEEVQSVLIKYGNGNEYTALNEESLLSMLRDIWDSNGKTVRTVQIQPQGRTSSLSVFKIVDLIENPTDDSYEINPDKITLNELRDKLSKEKEWYDDLDWSDFFKNQSQTNASSTDNIVKKLDVTVTARKSGNYRKAEIFNTLELYEFFKENWKTGKYDANIFPIGNFNPNYLFQININTKFWQNILLDLPEEFAIKAINKELEKKFPELNFDEIFKKDTTEEVYKVTLNYDTGTQRTLVCNNGSELFSAYRIIEDEAEGGTLEVVSILSLKDKYGSTSHDTNPAQEVGKGGFMPSQIYSFEDFEKTVKGWFPEYNLLNFFSGVNVGNGSVSNKTIVEKLYIASGQGFSDIEEVRSYLDNEAYVSGVKEVIFRINSVFSDEKVRVDLKDKKSPLYYKVDFRSNDSKYSKLQEILEAQKISTKYDWEKFFMFAPASTIVNQGSNLAPYEASQVTLTWRNKFGTDQTSYFYTDDGIGGSGESFISALKGIERESNGKDVEVTIRAYAKDNDGNDFEKNDYFTIGENFFKPSTRTNEQIKSVTEEWIDGLNFDKFFEDAIPLGVSQNINFKLDPNEVGLITLTYQDKNGSTETFSYKGSDFITELEKIESIGQGKNVKVDLMAYFENNGSTSQKYNDILVGGNGGFRVKGKAPEDIKSAVESFFRGLNFDKFFGGLVPFNINTSAMVKPFDFSDTKIWIGDNPELSRRVQEKAFESGYKWAGLDPFVQNTERKDLYFNSGKSINYGGNDRNDFDNATYFREITEQDIFGNQASASALSNKEKVRFLQLTSDAGGYINVSNISSLKDKIETVFTANRGNDERFMLRVNGLDGSVFTIMFGENRTCEICYDTLTDGKQRIKDILLSYADAENYDWSDFFEEEPVITSAQTPTVSGSSGSVQEIKDFKEAVGVLEGIASQASQKYNTKKYEESLELLKEVKEEYTLALSFTPESSFMYERIELMKKIAEIQKEITRITELKSGGAYYILSKVIDRLERAENWKELGNGEIMVNEVPQQEIDTVIYTEKFKNWFGDWEQALITKDYDFVSKAVTESGKPCVMFHGAKRIKYSYRQVSNGVIYLAENRSYAEWFSATDSPYQKQGDYLTQCFVNLKNPIDLTPFGVEEVDLRDIIQFIDALYPLAKIYDVLPPNVSMAIMNNQLIGRNFRAWYVIRQFPELNKHIRDNTTYDGFIYYENNPSDMILSESGEMVENVTKATAVFNSNQVKLVDAMLFDSSLDDWRFETGGKVN